MERITRSKLFGRLVAGLLTFVFAASTVLTGNVTTVNAAEVNAVVDHNGETVTTSDGQMEISKTIKAVEGTTDEFEITLSATALSEDKVTTSAVVFVIDRSNSMFEEGTNYMATTKIAANNAIDTLLTNENTKIAVVAYGSDVKSTDISAFYGSDEIAQAHAAVNNIKQYGEEVWVGRGRNGHYEYQVDTEEGATNIQAGIKAARELLAGVTADVKSIIVLSDGEPTYAYEITAISATAEDMNVEDDCGVFNWGLFRHGVEVSLSDYTVTAVDYASRVGSGSSSALSMTLDITDVSGIPTSTTCSHGRNKDIEEVSIADAIAHATVYEAQVAKDADIAVYTIALDTDSSVMDQMSSTGSAYTADAANLNDVYASIAGEIGAAISAASVTDPMGDVVNFVSVADNKGVTVSEDEVLTWNIGNISNGETKTLTYRVKLDPEKVSSLVSGNSYPTNGTTTITYTNNEDEVVTAEFDVPTVKIGRYFTIIFRDDDQSLIRKNVYLEGETVDVPLDPVKEETETTTYSFTGWDKTVSATAVADAEYVATYTESLKSFTTTVHYVTETENGIVSVADDNVFTSTVGDSKTYTSPAVNGYKLRDSSKAEVTATIGTTNADIYVYYDLIDYTVTFIAQGKSVGSDTYHYGDTVAVPSAPEKAPNRVEYYEFLGWSTSENGEVLERIPNVTGDATYYAIYKAEKQVYTVNFYYEVNDELGDLSGTFIKSVTANYEGTVNIGKGPEVEGFDCVSFTYENVEKETASVGVSQTLETGFTFTMTVKSDVNVYYNYEKKNFTVTFVDSDRTELSKETYEYGTILSDSLYEGTSTDELALAKNDNTKHYTFSGWTWSTEEDTLKENVTATATYSTTNVYEVKFVADNEVIATYYYEDGETIDTTPKATKAMVDGISYSFTNKWTIDGQTVSSSAVKGTVVTSDLTYTAVFEKVVKIGYYTCIYPQDTLAELRDQVTIISYDSKDYTTLVEAQFVGDQVTAEMEAAIKAVYHKETGYTVYGSNDSAKIAAVVKATESALSEDTVLPDVWYVVKLENGRWHIDGGNYNDYKITVNYVDTEGNTLQDSETMTVNAGTYDITSAYTEFTLDGRDYILDGFSTKGEAAAETSVTVNKNTGNAEVNFVFNKIYTVTVLLDENELPDADPLATVEEGTDATGYVNEDALAGYAETYADQLEAGKKLTEEGYTVSEDTTCTDFAAVNGDIVIAATTEDIIYNVKFVDENGDVLSNANYTYGKELVVAEDPSKDADKTYTYTFSGWDADKDGAVDEVVTIVTDDAEYTAVYTATYIDYTVRFFDYDESLLSEATYHYGDEVVEAEATASYSTVENDYTFAGWDKEVTKVIGNADYYAQYTSTAIDYTIIFAYKDTEGEDTSSTQIKNYGDEVVEPVVETYENDTTVFTFDHWTTEVDGEEVVVEVIPTVTGDATYTAVYTEETKQFTVTYVLDGIILDTTVVDAGTEVAPLLEKEYTPADGFTFGGWSTSETNEVVLRDVTIVGTTELIPEEEPEEEDPDEKGEVEADEDEIPEEETEDPEEETEDPEEETEDPEDNEKGEVEADEDIATGDMNYAWIVALMGAALIAIAAALTKKKMDASEE